MEFSARDDIEAPIDFVFGQTTNFPGFERSIMRRGGDVERVRGGEEAVVGTQWRVRFRMRGKDRVVDAELTEVDAPNKVTIEITSPSVDGKMEVELVALSRARTRLNVSIEVGAKTIPAKLMFQSMRFARAKTDKRLQATVSGFAEDVEARFRG